MNEGDYCFVYRGCLVMCDPGKAPGGGFAANAVVTRDDETLIASTSCEVPFLTPEAAFGFAREWAIRWIDANQDRCGNSS